MYRLAQFGLKEMTECGADLRRLGATATCLQDVANEIVRYLYDRLVDDDGRPACALVRVFKTHPTRLIGPELQRFAARKLAHGSLGDCPKCFVLLASKGLVPGWDDRTRSTRFQAIPVGGDAFVAQFPMFSQLLSQFGIDLHAFLKPGSDLIVDQEEHRFNVFHVEHAVDNPYIPLQQEFVRPYGIQSVLGFGSLLPSGEIFAVIVFSKIVISREIADRFQTLALCAKIALLPFDRQAVFT